MNNYSSWIGEELTEKELQIIQQYLKGFILSLSLFARKKYKSEGRGAVCVETENLIVRNGKKRYLKSSDGIQILNQNCKRRIEMVIKKYNPATHFIFLFQIRKENEPSKVFCMTVGFPRKRDLSKDEVNYVDSDSD